MMRKLLALAAVAVLLAGCTPKTEPARDTPSAEATIDDGGANGVACRAFYEAWADAVGGIDGGTMQADWDAQSAKVDEIALKAEGDVKARMLDLVSAWPDLAEVFILGEIDDVNKQIGAIERACDVAGENIDGLQLTESSE